MALVYIRDKNGNFVPVLTMKGDPGHTPVRGEDYWTEYDKDYIKEYVDNEIIGAEVIPVSEDRTLTKADAGKFLRVDAAASITVPADVFSVGVEIEIFRNTSGAVTIKSSGVSFAIPGKTALVAGSQTILDQYDSIVLKHIADNVWSVQGAVR